MNICLQSNDRWESSTVSLFLLHQIRRDVQRNINILANVLLFQFMFIGHNLHNQQPVHVH